MEIVHECLSKAGSTSGQVDPQQEKAVAVEQN
jgi:hypothetical protein